MQPIAFQIGSLAIHWYGVLMALGFVAGLWTASRRAPRSGFSAEQVLDLATWLIVGSIVGARALFVISYWEEKFAGKPWTEVFMIHHGGLVYYGGLIGACVAVVIHTALKNMPLWKMADTLSPSIPLGYAFGRIGCVMNGCCYGRECGLPWAIQFPSTHESYPAHVHPTQFYDALLSLGLYAALAWLYRRKKFDGQVFAAYLIGYAVARSVVELFRGDYAARYLGVLTPAHLVSAVAIVAGAGLWLLLARRPNRDGGTKAPS